MLTSVVLTLITVTPTLSVVTLRVLITAHAALDTMEMEHHAPVSHIIIIIFIVIIIIIIIIMIIVIIIIIIIIIIILLLSLLSYLFINVSILIVMAYKRKANCNRPFG